ncbi:serine--tRNA ligase [Candidatus Woesearchaeota archaeon]|nr:serine--tRNA ligase [Candidatus Woesearchaeota archaeon]
MILLRNVRENPDLYKKDCIKRHKPELVVLVDDVVRLDASWREHKKKTDGLRRQRNEISEQVNAEKKKGKDVSGLLETAKDIPKKIAFIEDVQKELEKKINDILLRLPNLMHASVPEGKDSSQNPEVRKWGSPVSAPAIVSHGELAEKKGLADFDTAAKVAGSGFNYLKEELALLDISLQRFAIDFMRSKGFTFMEVPMLLRRDAYSAVTPLNDFQDVMYPVDNDFFLIATAEHPLMAYFWDKVVDETELPIKLVGLSSAWRKEIGAHGVDTKGLFRMHQFNKVEQVVVCRPEESFDWLEKMQLLSEEMIKKLGIPYRIIEICSGDLSIKNAKQYDIEAWFPRQNKYAEIGSASNCSSWQSVRLNLRYRKGQEKEFPNTLNNTALATSRVMVAILENFQNNDGSIDIPKVLHKYTGFERIK